MRAHACGRRVAFSAFPASHNPTPTLPAHITPSSTRVPSPRLPAPVPHMSRPRRPRPTFPPRPRAVQHPCPTPSSTPAPHHPAPLPQAARAPTAPPRRPSLAAHCAHHASRRPRSQRGRTGLCLYGSSNVRQRRRPRGTHEPYTKGTFRSRLAGGSPPTFTKPRARPSRHARKETHVRHEEDLCRKRPGRHSPHDPELRAGERPRRAAAEDPARRGHAGPPRLPRRAAGIVPSGHRQPRQQLDGASEKPVDRRGRRRAPKGDRELPRERQPAGPAPPGRGGSQVRLQRALGHARRPDERLQPALHGLLGGRVWRPAQPLRSRTLDSIVAQGKELGVFFYICSAAASRSCASATSSVSARSTTTARSPRSRTPRSSTTPSPRTCCA